VESGQWSKIYDWTFFMPDLTLPNKKADNPFGVRFVSTEEFHSIVADKAPTENIAIHQPFVMDEVKASDDEKSREIKFVVSTEGVDRDRDIIKANGWNLKNFKKNPVVLWAHGYYDPPIAKAPNISVQDKKLVSVADFVPAEVSPFAESIFQMLKLGFLRTASVGFIPMKHHFDDERMGVDILQAELLEYSVVPVPSNPEALVQVRSILKGTSAMKSYVGWCEKFLDEEYGGKGVWVPQEQVEAVFKTMNELTAKKQVTVPGVSDTTNQSGGIVKTPVNTTGDNGIRETVIPLKDFEGNDITFEINNPESEPFLFVEDPEPEEELIILSNEEFETKETEPTIDISIEELNDAIKNVIVTGVGAIVTGAIRHELNYAKGIIE